MRLYPSIRRASQRLNSIRRPAKAAVQLLTTLLVFTLCLFPTLGTAATPHIYDVPQSGPPGSQTQTVGNGWSPNASIDVYFDSTDVGLITTDNNGSFGMALRAPSIRQNGFAVQIPKDAVPGQHWITAVERITQLQAQVPFTVWSDWPQFQFGPDRTGFNPYENVLSPETVVNLTTRWKHKYIDGYASPVVADGKLYQNWHSDDWHMAAFDARTGAQLWTYPAAASGVPAVVNGVIYYGGGDGFHALNANTGALLWSNPDIGGNYVSATAVAGDIVYCGSWSYVYALDASTGALLWNFYIGNYDWHIALPVAVAGGVVYAGSDYGLYALDAGTGALLWKSEVPKGVRFPPAVANGMVYVPSDNVYALNASTGALLWKYPVSGSSPAVANGVVYLGADGVYALDAGTGALLWWQSAVGYIYLSSPVTANGVVYAGSYYDHRVYALNASTGALLWHYNMGYPIANTPSVVNGMLYISSDHLSAFGLPDQRMSEKFSPPERPDPARLTPDWSLQPSSEVTPTLKK